MKQHYFVVVLAHSLHGRLRRIHVPHQALYVVLALALFGSVSLFGMVSSYLRMSWKVANYNALRDQVNTLRNRYQQLQQENIEKKEQLASLQLMASEVSVALGLKGRLEGADDIASEGPLVPSYRESLEEYNFLKSASYSQVNHLYARRWQTNIVPAVWPVNGRLLSRFGEREDPFSGEGALHTGVDISASMGTPCMRRRTVLYREPNTGAATARWWRLTMAMACTPGTRICRDSRWCRGRRYGEATSLVIREPPEK